MALVLGPGQLLLETTRPLDGVEYSRGMPTYEMFWDCPACGATKLLGKTHRHCPSCGHVQDPSYRYFPAEHEKILATDHVFVGVDWSCERCETPNSAAASHCVNCGDARDGIEQHVKRRSDVVAGTQAGSFAPSPVPASPRSSPRKWWKNPRLWLGAGALLAVTAIFCCAALLWSKPTTAQVTGHHWERWIEIERMQPVSTGGWCDGLPSDAYSVSRSRRQRSTNRIPDGESCSTVNSDNGDGTFSTHEVCHTTYREEPVYDDWCDYTVDRWAHDRTERSSGTGVSPDPTWPPYSVSGGSSLGSTRVGSKGGAYYVEMVDADGTEKDCDYTQERWRSMDVGTRWQGRKRILLDSLICSGLIPEGSG